MSDKLQGGAVMYWRCGGIFNCYLYYKLQPCVLCKNL